MSNEGVLMMQPDNRELEALMRKKFLKTLISTKIAYIGPYLFLARLADQKLNVGAMCTIRIREVKVLPQENYEVVYLKTFVSIDYLASKEHTEIILYTFRNVSASGLEPFICISKTSNGQELFAYCNDNEFIFEEMEKAGDEAALQKAKSKATEREMLSLARFVDLLGRALLESKLEGGDQDGTV